jgi:hypothetical protein
MAIIIPGPGTPSSGSLGSITYSRNRYGAYTRNRTNPVNPNSPLQSRSRQIFNAAIAAWGEMTGVQRTAWENWAASTPWLNKAGETVNLTGQVAFNRHYTAQMQFTYPAAPAAGFLVPPLENNVGSINVTMVAPGIAYTAATGTIAFTISAPAGATNTWAVAGGQAIVEMTHGQNLTRNYHGSRWSQLFEQGAQVASSVWAANEVVVAGSTDPADNPLHFPYGLQVGQKVWVRVRGISPVADRRVTVQFVMGPFILQAPV